MAGDQNHYISRYAHESIAYLVAFMSLTWPWCDIMMSYMEGQPMSKQRKVPYAVSHSQGGHSISVYRGYLIQPALCGDVFYVQKGGYTVGSGKTYEDAQRAIDAIHGD